MKASYLKAIIPTIVLQILNNNKKINEEVLPVWDVDIGAWRSFRIDSIKDIKKLEVVL